MKLCVFINSKQGASLGNGIFRISTPSFIKCISEALRHSLVQVSEHLSARHAGLPLSDLIKFMRVYHFVHESPKALRDLDCVQFFVVGEYSVSKVMLV